MTPRGKPAKGLRTRRAGGGGGGEGGAARWGARDGKESEATPYSMFLSAGGGARRPDGSPALHAALYWSSSG